MSDTSYRADVEAAANKIIQDGNPRVTGPLINWQQVPFDFDAYRRQQVPVTIAAWFLVREVGAILRGLSSKTR